MKLGRPVLASCLCLGPVGCRPAHPARAAAPVPAAAITDVAVTLFFIGDAGAPARPADSEPVLVALRAAVATAPHPVVGHRDRVTALDSTRFVQSASGFMRVEFLRDGRARLSVTVVDRHAGRMEAFALWLT